MCPIQLDIALQLSAPKKMLLKNVVKDVSKKCWRMCKSMRLKHALKIRVKKAVVDNRELYRFSIKTGGNISGYIADNFLNEKIS